MCLLPTGTKPFCFFILFVFRAVKFSAAEYGTALARLPDFFDAGILKFFALTSVEVYSPIGEHVLSLISFLIPDSRRCARHYKALVRGD